MEGCGLFYANRIRYFLLGAVILVMQLVPSGIILADSNLLDVQLISDQEHVGAGASMSFHILYHNGTNQNMSNVWFKMKVPPGLEVEPGHGAEWDAKNRMLHWRLGEVRANGAGVIPVSLKVKGDVKTGAVFELVAEFGVGVQGHLSNTVEIGIGTEIHQPFFIGYPDGNFHPTSYLTRAETAAIVARIKKLSGSDPKQHYKDVTQKHWAYRYIHQVTHAGYMNGHNGYFHPDAPITRAELVTLVLRLRGVRAVPLEGFDDLQTHWAGDIVGTAKTLQFIDGMDEKTFHPDGYTDRQSAAKLINIALLRGPLVDGEQRVEQHFPDVPRNHWSFGWVEEASLIAHESIRKGRGEEHLIRYLPDQTELY
jgi:hypothetical protein